MSLEKINYLRKETGAGIQDCKKAISLFDNNLEKAKEYLISKTSSIADKKSSRLTKVGVIGYYIHAGSKLAALLELNCETDFVSRKKEFKELANSFAMQLASNSFIEYLSIEKIPKDLWQKKESELIFRNSKKISLSSKIDIITDIKLKILEDFSTKTFLSQRSFKNNTIYIEDILQKNITNFKENIKIGQFIKFSVD